MLFFFIFVIIMAYKYTPSEIINSMKKRDLKSLEPGLFKNYPQPATLSKMSPRDFNNLVNLVERYIINEANKTLGLASSYVPKSPEFLEKREPLLAELTNFVHSFKDLGGNVDTLGHSMYPSYFTLGFRIYWLLGSGKEKILYDLYDFEGIRSKVNDFDHDIIRPMERYIVKNKNAEPYSFKQLNVGSRGGGSTPLQEAAWHGELDTVKVLIEKGVDINLQNIHWYSPLWAAIDLAGSEPLPNTPELLRRKKENARPIIKLLLDNDADVNICDTKGKSLLEHALDNKLPEDLVAEIQNKMLL